MRITLTNIMHKMSGLKLREVYKIKLDKIRNGIPVKFFIIII